MSGPVAARTLTVLFTDMVESTALFSTVSTREGQRLLDQHVAGVGDHVRRNGGQVIKVLGDGVMVSFTSAGCAIDAAVDMQSTCSHPMRVGISSGDIHLDGSDWFGLAVVEASRLCDEAGAGQVLVAERTRLLAPEHADLDPVGPLHLKGMREPTMTWEARASRTRVRALIGDDSVLVREGLARVLASCGIEVIAEAADADEVLRRAAELHPDIVVIDVRMPPTFTTEGIDAAVRLLGDNPSMGVLVLSQEVHPTFAQRLRAARAGGVGYLCKDRVVDVHELGRAVRRVAAGMTAFEQELQLS